MSVKAHFICPQCERPSKSTLPGEWQCVSCDHRIRVDLVESELSSCPLCGNPQLYRKKNFPHWLGMGILALASIGFLVAHGLYYPRIAWGVLIGSAVLDGLLYKIVGDAVVCYRCHSHFTGLPSSEHYPAHDLGISERFRQERIRHELMEKEKSQ